MNSLFVLAVSLNNVNAASCISCFIIFANSSMKITTSLYLVRKCISSTVTVIPPETNITGTPWPMAILHITLASSVFPVPFLPTIITPIECGAFANLFHMNVGVYMISSGSSTLSLLTLNVSCSNSSSYLVTPYSVMELTL